MNTDSYPDTVLDYKTANGKPQRNSLRLNFFQNQFNILS